MMRNHRDYGPAFKIIYTGAYNEVVFQYMRKNRVVRWDGYSIGSHNTYWPYADHVYKHLRALQQDNT
jgi:hypothetical protein